MKIIVKILFYVFLIWILLGGYLAYIDFPKSEKIIGFGVLFLFFILMPLFIFHRFNQGKYKKYVLDPKSENPFKIDKDKL